VQVAPGRYDTIDGAVIPGQKQISTRRSPQYKPPREKSGLAEYLWLLSSPIRSSSLVKGEVARQAMSILACQSNY